jgi:two-component system response regulator (stage 0 sporulation protein F)
LTEEKRILVVDDDDSIRLMVERVLRRDGYSVDGARDGFEAIEKLGQNDYLTILLDLMMPGLDGIGVLEYLERHRPELGRQVIVMSANIPAATDAARLAQVARVLAKPFDLSDLRSEVHGLEIANRQV